MAVFLLQQQNVVADSGFNVGCSGATAEASPDARQILRGGSAGSIEITIDPGNGLTRACLAFQSDTGIPEPGVTTWQAGDYVVRLNVTTARSGMIWEETYICERTSGAVFNTVASLTGQTTTMDAGTQTHTVNRGTDFSPLDANSTLYIVMVFTGPAHGGSNAGVTPSLVVDTPIDDGVSASGWNHLLSGHRNRIVIHP